MSDQDMHSNDAIVAAIKGPGFAFVPAGEMGSLLGVEGMLPDWEAFTASWSDLPEDTYMADAGRYRQRRHAAFAVGVDGPVLCKPAQPHYQSRDRNPLNGGIERWFEPVVNGVACGLVMGAVFDFCRGVLGQLRPEVRSWHVEMHQFRILARSDEPGQPTPEGMHRDGVDFVFVMLVHRENVVQGTTEIADVNKRVLGAFTLADPLDVALVDDRFLYHGVTAIEPKDPGQRAFRDVLVVTWKLED